MIRYEALYTNRLVQKQKRFQDGTIVVDSNKSGKLLDEDGEMIVSKIPPKDWDSLPEFQYGGYLIHVVSRKQQQQPKSPLAAPPIQPFAKPSYSGTSLLKRSLNAQASSMSRYQSSSAPSPVNRFQNNNTPSSVNNSRGDHFNVPKRPVYNNSPSSILKMLHTPNPPSIDDFFNNPTAAATNIAVSATTNKIVTNNNNNNKNNNNNVNQVVVVAGQNVENINYNSAASSALTPILTSIRSNTNMLSTLNKSSSLRKEVPNHLKKFNNPFQKSNDENIDDEMNASRSLPSTNRLPSKPYLVGPVIPIVNLSFTMTPSSSKNLNSIEVFQSEHSYNQYFSSAIILELNSKLVELYEKYQKINSESNSHDNGSYRKRGIHFYNSLTLFQSKPSNFTQKKGKRKRPAKAAFSKKKKMSWASKIMGKGGSDDDDDEGEEEEDDDDEEVFEPLETPKQTRSFISVKGSLEPSKNYAQGDLWYLFKSRSSIASGIFVVSLWHSFGRNNTCEVQHCFDVKQGKISNTFVSRGSDNEVPLMAIRCFSVSSENAIFNSLNDATSVFQPQLLPLILGKSLVKASSSLPMFDHDVESVYQEVSEEFKLNVDQQALLEKCKEYMDSYLKKNTSATVTLCHGVFGSGKSYVLEAVIVFFSKVADKKELPRSGPSAFRILLCTITNIAVDRILLGLVNRNFLDIARVGSLKKISKPLLKYTLHYSEKEGKSSNEEALLILREMQREENETLGANKRHSKKDDHIQSAINDLEANINRTETLTQARLLGVTSAASVFPILDNSLFVITMLDEVSQMIEPTSIMPLQKFKSSHVIAVGDTNQLPPVLNSTSSVLKCTLFERLKNIGNDSIMLRTQYRLHPILSGVPNELYYEGKLLDGIDASQRQSLLIHRKNVFPPLLTINVPNGSENKLAYSNSYVNTVEAKAISTFIHALIKAGFHPSKVGVICFYKDQVGCIQRSLEGLSGEMGANLMKVQISTVDAFQGSEKDIVVLSTVRTLDTTTSNLKYNPLTFISDKHRLNVALTRAKYHLLIFGKIETLTVDKSYNLIIDKATNIQLHDMEPVSDVAMTKFAQDMYEREKLKAEAEAEEEAKEIDLEEEEEEELVGLNGDNNMSSFIVDDEVDLDVESESENIDPQENGEREKEEDLNDIDNNNNNQKNNDEDENGSKNAKKDDNSESSFEMESSEDILGRYDRVGSGIKKEKEFKVGPDLRRKLKQKVEGEEVKMMGGEEVVIIEEEKEGIINVENKNKEKVAERCSNIEGDVSYVVDDVVNSRGDGQAVVNNKNDVNMIERGEGEMEERKRDVGEVEEGEMGKVKEKVEDIIDQKSNREEGKKDELNKRGGQENEEEEEEEPIKRRKKKRSFQIDSDEDSD